MKTRVKAKYILTCGSIKDIRVLMWRFIMYLHKTERMTDVPCVLIGELSGNAECSALQPNSAWLSWAVGRNLILLVTVLHPLHTSLEDETSDGDVSKRSILQR